MHTYINAYMYMIKSYFEDHVYRKCNYTSAYTCECTYVFSHLRKNKYATFFQKICNNVSEHVYIYIHTYIHIDNIYICIYIMYAHTFPACRWWTAYVKCTLMPKMNSVYVMFTSSYMSFAFFFQTKRFLKDHCMWCTSSCVWMSSYIHANTYLHIHTYMHISIYVSFLYTLHTYAYVYTCTYV